MRPHPLPLSLRGWGEGVNICYFRFWEYLSAVLFCEIQIIFWKCILGVKATPNHASAAVTTARALGSFSAEKWVRDSNALFTEKRTHIRWAEGVPRTAFFCDLLEDFICFPQFGIAR